MSLREETKNQSYVAVKSEFKKERGLCLKYHMFIMSTWVQRPATTIRPKLIDSVFLPSLASTSLCLL